MFQDLKAFKRTEYTKNIEHFSLCLRVSKNLSNIMMNRTLHGLFIRKGTKYVLDTV